MKDALIVAISLVLAAGAQSTVSTSLAIFGACPDFLLVAVTLLSMRKGADAAAMIGFLAGLLHGGTANGKMTAFIISRILGALTASAVGRTSVAATPLTVMSSALAASGVASLAYLLLGVPKDLVAWALSAFGTVVYNTLLVGAVYSLFGRAKHRD